MVHRLIHRLIHRLLGKYYRAVILSLVKVRWFASYSNPSASLPLPQSRYGQCEGVELTSPFAHRGQFFSRRVFARRQWSCLLTQALKTPLMSFPYNQQTPPFIKYLRRCIFVVGDLPILTFPFHGLGIESSPHILRTFGSFYNSVKILASTPRSFLLASFRHFVKI